MLTILLVEDDPATLKLLESTLGDRYAVQTATNGIEALAAVKERPPDLIISDVMMPQMDGWELHRTLRQEKGYKHLPFIFLTAKARIDAQDKKLYSAADHFVSKPFSFQKLRKKVDDLVGREK